jgi:hypothetical protein
MNVVFHPYLLRGVVLSPVLLLLGSTVLEENLPPLF